MSVRIAGVLLVALATPAAAGTFGGFSGVDKPYLVNSDRVCTPLKVELGDRNRFDWGLASVAIW